MPGPFGLRAATTSSTTPTATDTDDDLAASSPPPASPPASTPASPSQPAALFVDPLAHLPADVVFLIELCLPVQTMVSLSAVNVTWSRHLCESHWHRVFQARWSHCYEGGQGLTVSPSILSRLTGNYHSFWATIEKAFMGDYSIVGTRQRDSLFEKLFKLLQPAMGGGDGADDDADEDDNINNNNNNDGAPTPSSSSSSYASFFSPSSMRMMNGWPYYYSKVVSSTPVLPSSWKLACILRDRAEGRNVLMGCRFCSELDVFTQHMREQESSCPTQLRTWVVPCLCPALVHRRCLEAHVAAAQLQPSLSKTTSSSTSTSSSSSIPTTDEQQPPQQAAAPAQRRKWISYDTALLPTAAQDLKEEKESLGPCPRCGSFYVPGFRLPTVGELLSVTWQDDLAWKRAGDCILMWLMGVAIVALSEALYQGKGELLAWPEEGGQVLFWWILQYVISLNIFLSPRFARVVDLLWLGPIFRFYAKLYLYFLMATFGMLCFFSPLPRRVLGVCFAEVVGVPAWMVLVGGWGNFAVLATITSIVIFLFWKTNYRIPTIADLREAEPGGSEHPMLSIGGA